MILRIIKIVFLLACLGFFTKFFVEARGSVSRLLAESDYHLFVYSVVILMFLVVLTAIYSTIVLNAQGKQCRVMDMLLIYVRHLPGKYVPGGIWQTVGRASELRENGFSKKSISILVLYENLWSILIASLMCGLAVYYFHGDSFVGLISVAMFLGSLIVYLALFIVKIEEFVFTSNYYLGMTAISVVFWVLSATSFNIYVESLHVVSDQYSFLRLGSDYLFSYLVGFVSIFSPQGIGVFEYSLAKLSVLQVSIAEAIVIFSGYRVLILINDLLCWLMYVLYSAGRIVFSSRKLYS